MKVSYAGKGKVEKYNSEKVLQLFAYFSYKHTLIIQWGNKVILSYFVARMCIMTTGANFKCLFQFAEHTSRINCNIFLSNGQYAASKAWEFQKS